MKIRVAKDIFKHDYQRKLIAVFFALLIWVIVNQRISKVQTFSGIPIELINPNTNIIISSSSNPTASIILRGPEAILKSLKSKDISVQLIIPEGVKPGTLNLLLDKSDISIPGMTTIENIVTDNIIIEVDELSEKEVPVRLLFNNALADNYRLSKSPNIEPNNKIIRGPSKRLDSINYLTTKPFLIDSSRTKDYISSVAVSIPTGVKTEFDKVKVVVGIETASKIKPLRRQPLSVMGDSKFSVTELPFVDAVISGPPNMIDDITTDDFKFFVEYSKDAKLKVKFWCKYDTIFLQSVMPEYIANPEAP